MEKPNEIENTAPDSGYSFWRNAIVGFVIGIGAILPGVSGGVLAVSLGLYRPMIDAAAGFFRAPKKNALFLLPICIGAVAGILLGAVVLDNFMHKYYTQVMYLFIGLVAGGVPSFLKEANEEGFRPKYLIATLIGALAASALLFLERDSFTSPDVGTLTFAEGFISGAIISAGILMPGVSVSFILMYLGWYRPAMAAIAALDIISMIPIGIGVAVGFLAMVSFARFVFRRFHGWAYYAMLGFLIISAILIFPGFSFSFGQVVSIILMAGGFAGAYFFAKLEN